MIPNYTPPLPGESLYSFFLRLALCNGASNVNDLFHLYTCIPDSVRKSYTLRDELFYAQELLGVDVSEVRDLFIKLDTFPFLITIIPPFNLSSMLNRRFRLRRKGGYFSKYMSEMSSVHNERLMLCPECAREDIEKYGFYYFRREHQLMGVNMCTKHKVPLKEYKGAFGHEMVDGEWEESKKQDEEAELKYAVFANKLLNSCFDIDATTMKNRIASELTVRGVTAGDYTDIKDFLAEKNYLNSFYYTADLGKNIFGIKHKHFITKPRTMFLLFEYMGIDLDDLCFPNRFDKDLAKAHCAEMGFKVVGEIYENYPIVVKCMECGYSFITNYKAITSGWGCPKCDYEKTDHQIISEMVDKCGNGEYVYCEDNHDSVPRELKLLHKKCGKYSYIRFGSFIAGQRCKCETMVSYDEMVKRVKKLGPYKLLRYTKTAEKMLVLNTQCNHEFEITYHNLKKLKGGCPKCESGPALAHKKMIKIIKDLTGDEYELVRWIDHDHVEIKHCVCGSVSVYRYDGFVSGVRCNCENRHMSAKAFKTFVVKVSNGRYVTESDIIGKEKIFIHDTSCDTKLGPFKKRFIIQELTRPTQSDVLPLESRSEVRVPINSLEEFMWKLDETFGRDNIFSLREASSVMNASYGAIAHKLSRLYTNGSLKKRGKNQYYIPSDAE